MSVLSDNTQKENVEICVQFENSTYDDVREVKKENHLKVPPIPKPRLSLLTKKANSVHMRSNSVPHIDEHSDTFPCRPPRRRSECPQSPTTAMKQFTEDVAEFDSIFNEKEREKEMNNDNKANTHSNAFQKLGNLFKSKKLSLRRNSKTKTTQEVKPVRPKRSPPLPPAELHFRPAAPLPEYSCEPEVYDNGSTLTFYDRESQYTSDSDVYATVADSNSLADSSDHYEELSDYEKLTDTDDDEDLYQDVYECRFSDEQIYEVLPGEEHSTSDTDSKPAVYVDSDNNYCRKVHSHSERKLKKREKKRALRAAKLRKKFNLTGNEIPVNAGVVIEDAKGTNSDLLVHKGEVVLILRMEGNPPGKWLVKNERDKIGFVDLQNIDVDPESIKSIMKIPALYET